MRSSWLLALVLAAVGAACGGGGDSGPGHPGDAAAGGDSSSDLDVDVTPADGPGDADAGQPPDAGGGDLVARDGGFGPVTGLDPGGLGRRVGNQFYVAAQTVLTGGDGTGWVLWRGYQTPTFGDGSVHLDRFEADGVFVRSSALERRDPDGVVLHGDGSLTAYRQRCGPMQADTCFHRDRLTGDISETVWPFSSRATTRYRIDGSGNVIGGTAHAGDPRSLVGAVGHGDGLYALTFQSGVVLSRLDASYVPSWTVEVLPPVVPPDVPGGAPIEEILRAADLAHQFPANPVAVADGVVVAATVARGTLAAVSAVRGIDLAKPDDPRCPDVVVAHLRADGSNARYFAVPTPGCDRLPKLAVVDNHAVVATVVGVEKPPEPNDTKQFDIGLAIVNLASGEVRSRMIAMHEDDWVHGLAACGPGRVCLAGVTGARSVDTGSTVTNGEGFVLPVSLAGVPEAPWKLTSARHSEIQHLVPRPGGLLFFATVDGPITHTADGDLWLGFNKGMLGTIEGP